MNKKVIKGGMIKRITKKSSKPIRKKSSYASKVWSNIKKHKKAIGITAGVLGTAAVGTGLVLGGIGVAHHVMNKKKEEGNNGTQPINTNEQDAET